MRLQFDPNQTYQLDAIAAVTDLFEGQPQRDPDYSIIDRRGLGDLLIGQWAADLGVGNRMLLAPKRLLANTRGVQERNDIEVSNLSAPLEAWELVDGQADVSRTCPHFSVEMETGTGKTYVYLRTIFELSCRYGFQKFIVVVPSVAIREGVLKNIEITAEHFRTLYNNVPFEHFVYDAKSVNRLRQFAASTTLQIMVINVDAFRRNFTGTESQQKSNVIYKESDKLSGHQPIAFVQATRPIVIIDEPQSVDSTERAQEALRALNPLCTLRYSATHRNLYNLVYRLDPVRALELRLVKQIVVADVAGEGGANDAFVRVERIDYKKGIRARLFIHTQTAAGPKERAFTVKNGVDLYELSGNRAAYENGYAIAEISAEPGNAFVRFGNGKILRQGEQCGGMQEDLWRAQIKHTIRRHLEKELQLLGRRIKVLSLFFIDRVANYRGYDSAGQAVPGKFAEAFEDALLSFSSDHYYASLEWLKRPVGDLHNGYFAQDKKSILKDSREGRDTRADQEAYNLIMRDKEKLLSEEEPLRFIFTHTALREGWDNPNVFQICTLNETRSTMKKRQELGRGLRLPVDQDGKRVFDDSVNRLLVMANESYDDYARALQTEYEEECGVTFGKVPLTALAKIVRVVDNEAHPIGRNTAIALRDLLITQKMLDPYGRIQPAFDPKSPDFKIDLPMEYRDLKTAVIDLLVSYQVERHIRVDRNEGPNRLLKDVRLSREFEALWKQIKPRTTYRVEFETDTLVLRAVAAIRRMSKIESPKIRITDGKLDVKRGGITTAAVRVTEERVSMSGYPVPDILAYLQNETELTRSTLVRILKECNRLEEFFTDPQRFMDAVVYNLKHELYRLLVDGIKYERLAPGPDSNWEMVLFKNEELISYLSAVRVHHSLYEYIVYESEVEREFARTLDEREDIKLFVKLPTWFEIETPVGHYNPDWAILKHDGSAMYLVRETKGTKDFLKLRTAEADKVRCGQRHFEAIGVDFRVVVTADEV